MKFDLSVRYFVALAFMATLFTQTSCENEPEPDKKISPTDNDLVGFWKLNRVTLNDSDVSFDYREPRLTAEYLGFFADKRLHQIKRYSLGSWAENLNWNLDEDLVETVGIFEEFYKIHSFSESKLIISLNARQNVKLEFVPVAEIDFPEVAFTAEISGEKAGTTFASFRDYGLTLQIEGSANTFLLAIHLPATATTGERFSKVNENPTFSALIHKDHTDYGTLEEGYVEVIKRTSDYIHIEFEFTVKSNTGDEKLVVRQGSIRGFISPQ